MYTLRFVLLFCLAANAVCAQGFAAADPRLKIDHWLKRNDRVTESLQYQQAQEVFESLMKVADKPVDVLPKLYIFSNLEFSKVFALQDGAIILPLEVIDFCFRSPAFGKARLAFVLGHELKHVVHRDYWAVQRVLKFADGTQDGSMEVRRDVETQADAYGILYAALAGYDVEAINSSQSSFISDYYREAGVDVHGDVSNKAIAERLQAVNRRLSDITTHLDLFHFSVRLYAIGEYDAAIDLLEKFVTQFPSREVYNNLGMCYYQKALSQYTEGKKEGAELDPNLIYRVSTQIDLIPRLRTKALGQQSFTEMIDKAIKSFEEAKLRDERYEIAQNNLACAYLLKGELDFARGHLRKALELNRQYAEAHNNLGVARIAEGNIPEADKCFREALRLRSDYPAPLYNLGRLKHQIGQIAAARTHFEKYLQLDASSGYANEVKKLLGRKTASPSPAGAAETIAERTPDDCGQMTNGRSNGFVTPQAEIAIVHDPSRHVSCYQFLSKTADERIALLRTEKGFDGASTQGIRIGSPARLMKEKYPWPCKIIESTAGALWWYRELNLVFEIRDGSVAAWYVYEIM